MLYREMLNILDTNIRWLQVSIQGEVKENGDRVEQSTKDLMITQMNLMTQEINILAELQRKTEQEKL